MMTWWSLLFAVLAAGGLQAPRIAPSTASVAGVVLDATTGGPLPFAYVQITSVTARVNLKTTSDSRGAFDFTGVPAGTYFLVVDKPGRPRVFYGGVGGRAFDTGEPIVVAAGATINGLRVEVPRGAVIAGRVFDTNGEPAVNVALRARRTGAVSTRGQPFAAPPLTAFTNVRGEYRLWGLPPGEYTLAVLPYDNRLERRYLPLYFPGVTDASQSDTIRVAPGEERSEVDFRLVEGPATAIAGSVLGADAPPGWLFSVALWPRDERAEDGARSVTTGRDGGFSIPGVIPGEYWLGAKDRRPMPAGSDSPGWALIPVTVGSEPLSGLSLVLRPWLTAKGKLRIVVPTGESADASQLWVTATSNYGGFATDRSESQVTAAGEFELRHLTAGRYRVSVTRRQYGPPVTVRELVVNGTPTNGSEFDIAVGASAPTLDIVVLPPAP